MLNVDAYTRRVRSYILFNHLTVSKLSSAHVSYLLQGDWLKRIVDHRNYNPRIIASASSDCLDSVEPEQYPSYLYHALENPNLIWNKPFRALSLKCQNLLICIFFFSEHGVNIEILRGQFEPVHKAICDTYSQARQPSDYEDALRSLESGFISISDRNVNLINPALRDFLRSYLIELSMLECLPNQTKRADWAMGLWQHLVEVFRAHPSTVSQLAGRFRSYSAEIDATPTIRTKRGSGGCRKVPDDLPVSGRIELLLGWWEHTHDDNFLQTALCLLKSDSLALVAWKDAQSLPKLQWWIKNFVEDCNVYKAQLTEEIQRVLVSALGDGIGPDELLSVVESVYEHFGESIPVAVESSLDDVIDYEFSEICDAISDLDSESSLVNHEEFIDRLAELSGRDPRDAKEAIHEKIAELEEPPWDDEHPSFASGSARGSDHFSDAALVSLFSTLVSR